jgi:starch-binding outer membrane protein SusE/F
MKIKTWLLLAFSLVVWIACEKEGDKITLLGGTEMVLDVSSKTDLVLTKTQENFNSLQFQWTSPEYKFSNGVNTQDVNYTLQIDKDGGDFTGAKVVNLDYKKLATVSFKVKDLNNALAGLELTDGVPNIFQFRVKSTLANRNSPVTSNVVKIKISTYLDVVFPVPAKLYITGPAAPELTSNGDGWMDAGETEVISQKFTQINAYTFVINSLQINGGKQFLIVPVYGNWDNKYGFTGEEAKNIANGDSFKPGGNNFLAPPISKAYKITFNFKTGKYTFE